MNMNSRLRVQFVWLVAFFLAVSPMAAQRGPVPDPLVKVVCMRVLRAVGFI